MSKICEKCGRVMRDNARFCMTCGTSFYPEKEEAAKPEEVAENTAAIAGAEDPAGVKEAFEEVSEASEAAEEAAVEAEKEIGAAGETAAEETVKYEDPAEGPKEEAGVISDTAAEKSAKKKNKKWIWAAVCAVIVIGIAVCVLALTGVIF